MHPSESCRAGQIVFLVAAGLTLVTEGLLAVAAAALFGDPALPLTGTVRVGVLALLAKWAYTGSRRANGREPAMAGVAHGRRASKPGRAPPRPVALGTNQWYAGAELRKMGGMQPVPILTMAAAELLPRRPSPR